MPGKKQHKKVFQLEKSKRNEMICWMKQEWCDVAPDMIQAVEECGEPGDVVDHIVARQTIADRMYGGKHRNVWNSLSFSQHDRILADAFPKGDYS